MCNIYNPTDMQKLTRWAALRIMTGHKLTRSFFVGTYLVYLHIPICDPSLILKLSSLFKDQESIIEAVRTEAAKLASKPCIKGKHGKKSKHRICF